MHKSIVFANHFKALKSKGDFSMKEYLKLSTENVQAIYNDCLFRKDQGIEFAFLREGYYLTVLFDHEKIKEHNHDISRLCEQLPRKFMKSSREGDIFLNLWKNNEGQQWAKDHVVMDQLMIMGLATEKIELIVPTYLTEGMPYIVVNDEQEEAVRSFYEEIEKSVPIPEDIQEVIDKNFMDLI